MSKLTGVDAGPVVLYIDNKSAIDLAKNSVFHGRSKHIDVMFHFIRECVDRKEIIISHVNSDLQKENILTKGLSTVKFERMRSILGVKELGKQVSY